MTVALVAEVPETEPESTTLPRINLTRVVGDYCSSEIQAITDELEALDKKRDVLLAKREEIRQYQEIFTKFNVAETESK